MCICIVRYSCIKESGEELRFGHFYSSRLCEVTEEPYPRIEI